MAEGSKLSLADIPTLYAYEDYIAALLMTKGYYYLDRSIKKKTPGIGDELELDIVLSRYESNSEPVNKQLVEIKSGGWGLDDIFKIRGWMDYMKFQDTLFVVQKANEKSFPRLQTIAEKLDIRLVDNPVVDGKLDDQKIIDTLGLSVPVVDNSILQTIRFAMHLERMMDGYLNKMKQSKKGSGIVCYENISRYWFKLNNTPFFENNADQRIAQIFNCWIENKNIAARVDHELNGEGWLDAEECGQFVDGHYIDIFYGDVKINPVMIALHIELLNRLSILKACVDEIVEPQKTPETFFERLMQNFGKAALPANISMALEVLKEEPYFHLYPRFWQLFIYAFGGFILLNNEQEEYELLSNLSGIPLNNVAQAFNAFDTLFPGRRSWLRKYNHTNIKMLAMMPPQFLGLGANMRRLLYRDGDNEELASYEHLGKLITGNHTLGNLIHWNNITYEFLKKDNTLIHTDTESFD